MPSSLFGPSQSQGIQGTYQQNPQQYPKTNHFQMPQKFSQFMNLMKAGGNPKAMIENAITSNPQYNNVMGLINKHGGDAKAAFYDLAAQKGIDPEQFLNSIR